MNVETGSRAGASGGARGVSLWLLGSLVLVMGCSSSQSEPAGGEVEPAGNAIQETTAPEAAVRGPVEVVVDEFNIYMPERIPPGPTTFQVRNAGLEQHNFEVVFEGEEIFRFRAGLGPAAVRTAELDLEEGVYLIICTEAGHDSRGMMRELVVSATP